MSEDNTALESASEYAGLLSDLAYYSRDAHPKTADTLEAAAAAIRALEAKVRELEKNEAHLAATAGGWFDKAQARRLESDELRADCDRLAAEVERLLNHTNRFNGCTCWSYTSHEKQHAENCVLAIHAAEVAALREDAERYRWLKDHAYLWPTMPCTSVDQFERCALWLDDERVDIDAEIDAARRAGEGEK